MQQDASRHVHGLLKVVYGVLPLVAGLDKFFNILVDWSSYVSPAVASVIPVGTLMVIVGIIEIIVGLFVLSGYTRLGGYVVAVWLTLIALNLIILGQYDVAVRDLVMAAGAYSLAVLTPHKQSEGSHDSVSAEEM